GLFRRRAAILSVLALGTMPLFVLQGRQLASDMPLVAGLALSLGGLGRYTWPSDGRRSARDLAIGLGGMVIGRLSRGALLGVALPCLALGGTLVAGWGLSARRGDAPALAAAGVGPDVPEGKSFGAGLFTSGVRGRAVLALLTLGGVVLLVVT